MEFILASSNPHKAQEFSVLLNPNILSIKPAENKIEVDESGSTYTENAFLKAKAYFDKFRKPVVADDSGLNVDALPEDLGVHSARFGGDGLSDKHRCELLVEKLKNYPDLEQRKAYFSCVLCFYLSEDEVFFFEGRVDGHIDFQQRGDAGFGYDPLFIPIDGEDGASLAMIPSWKEKHSHRAVACGFAQRFFSERNCQT